MQIIHGPHFLSVSIYRDMWWKHFSDSDELLLKVNQYSTREKVEPFCAGATLKSSVLMDHLMNEVLHTSLQTPPAKMNRHQLVRGHVGTVTIMKLFLQETERGGCMRNRFCRWSLIWIVQYNQCEQKLCIQDWITNSNNLLSVFKKYQ